MASKQRKPERVIPNIGIVTRFVNHPTLILMSPRLRFKEWENVASLSNKTPNASLPVEQFAEISCEQVNFPQQTPLLLRYPLSHGMVEPPKKRAVDEVNGVAGRGRRGGSTPRCRACHRSHSCTSGGVSLSRAPLEPPSSFVYVDFWGERMVFLLI